MFYAHVVLFRLGYFYYLEIFNLNDLLSSLTRVVLILLNKQMIIFVRTYNTVPCVSFIKLAALDDPAC